jgi:hypothetical protein
MQPYGWTFQNCRYNALIPYVQFRLVDGEDDLVIHEIMVGPSPTQHLMKSCITGVVKQNRQPLLHASVAFA